ncbi:MAG: hypothetical protein KIT20_01080 [Alphaproteobacteria bacterium]|nr:hypothetical protein [Alphaproteobacteria bacterium]
MRATGTAGGARQLRLRLSFRASIMAVSLVTILVTSAAVHFPWHFTSRENNAQIVGTLNQTILDGIRREIDELFRSTEVAQQTVLELLEKDIVRIEDRERREQMMFGFLRANRHFSWVSFGRPDGNFYGAQRRDEDNFRLVESIWSADRAEATRTEAYYASDGEGIFATQTKVKTNDYFAPGREWYRLAVDSAGQHVWTDVYVFASSGKPGINSAITFDRDGELVGVVSIAIELDRISTYLRELRIAEGGQAFIVNREGEIIAFSDPAEVTTASGTEYRFLRKLGESWNPVLRIANLAIKGSGIDLNGVSAPVQAIQVGPEDHERYFVTMAPAGRRDWLIGTVIPERDFMTGIERNQERLLYTILAAVVLVVLVAAGVSRWLFIHPITRMIRQSARIRRFDTGSIEPVPSLISELEGLSAAQVSMAQGLESFRRYLPADLLQTLMEQGVAAEVGGERRTMTVLFMDLANFTTLTERMGHRILPMLGDYLGAMSKGLIAHRATIDKFIGDAVMAFWGAPRFNEEHPTDACRAALDCQRRMAELKARWRGMGLPELDVRIGINTGRVVVGNIGSAERLDYTVIGDPVNLASRLEGLNKLYGTGIIIGQSTYELAKYDIVARRLDYVNVKGKDETIAVYELLEMADGPMERPSVDWIRAYEEGLEFYRGGEYERAQHCFRRAIDLRGGDAPAARYVDLCAQKLMRAARPRRPSAGRRSATGATPIPLPSPRETRRGGAD